MAKVTEQFVSDVAVQIAEIVIAFEPSIPARSIYAFVAGYFAAGPTTYSIDKLAEEYLKWWYV